MHIAWTAEMSERGAMRVKGTALMGSLWSCNPRRLTDRRTGERYPSADYRSPSWSPDGTKVAIAVLSPKKWYDRESGPILCPRCQ